MERKSSVISYYLQHYNNQNNDNFVIITVILVDDNNPFSIFLLELHNRVRCIITSLHKNELSDGELEGKIHWYMNNNGYALYVTSVYEVVNFTAHTMHDLLLV